MKNYGKTAVVFLLILVILLTSCGPQNTQAGIDVTSPSEQAQNAVESTSEPVSEEMNAASSASETAVNFYSAYIAGMNHTGPTFDSADFPAAESVSLEYLRQLDEIKAGFEGGGFDPVVQAQIAPPDPVEVKSVEVDGAQAVVVLQFGRGKMETPFERSVSLAMMDGQWKIVPDYQPEQALTPEETVNAFYAWYLNQTVVGGAGNPLSNRAYHTSPYLSTSLIRKVDLAIEQPGGMMFDPFLCAHDVPSEIQAVASYDNALRPVVVVDTSFENHTIIVDLVRSNFNQWSIMNFTCGNNPTGAAKGFYAWALAYMTGGDDMRNPWVDGAYRQSPYLSAAMINELDARMAGGEALPEDPVLLSQTLPQEINTSPCPGEQACAFVNLQYGDSTVRQLRVDFQMDMGAPRIINIGHSQDLESPLPEAPPANIEKWVPFVDEQYGYSIRYPLEWRVEGLHVNDLHTAQEYPIMRTIQFNAPDLPDDIPALRMEVYIGDEEAFRNSGYDLAYPLEEIAYNGYQGTLYRSEQGMLTAVFQHPARPDCWIAIQDMVTQFTGREQYAQPVEGVFEAVLTTIDFAE